MSISTNRIIVSNFWLGKTLKSLIVNTFYTNAFEGGHPTILCHARCPNKKRSLEVTKTMIPHRGSSINLSQTKTTAFCLTWCFSERKTTTAWSPLLKIVSSWTPWDKNWLVTSLTDGWHHCHSMPLGVVNRAKGARRLLSLTHTFKKTLNEVTLSRHYGEGILKCPYRIAPRLL